MIQRMFMAVLVAMLAACASPGGPSIFLPTPAPLPSLPAEQIARIDALLLQTRELLLLAPDVARIKWNAKIPVVNKAAEAELVNGAALQAPRYKADPRLFKDFFQAQVDASRFVQTELHRQWREQNVPPVLTLTRSAAQIQVASDTVTPKLMAALAAIGPTLAMPGAKSTIEMRANELLPTRSSLSDPTRRISIAPLLARAAN